MEEAKVAREIFLGNGFEVEAICCKVGSIDKEKLGLKDERRCIRAALRPYVTGCPIHAVGQGRHATECGDWTVRGP